LAHDSGSKGGEIGFDVGEFGHAVRLQGCMGEMQGGGGWGVRWSSISMENR
jgi:hypothetical protein